MLRLALLLVLSLGSSQGGDDPSPEVKKSLQDLADKNAKKRLQGAFRLADLKVGGKYRYVWRNVENGNEMGMGGVFREIVAPERIVSTEKFEQEWYPGEAVGTLVLAEHEGKTTVTQTMQYDSRATRDAVLQSPMESGVEASYQRLEQMLTSGDSRAKEKGASQ